MWGNVSAQCWGVILPCHIPPWSNGRLKHQVEGDGRCELVSCGRGLDAVFYEKVRQLFLGVVVQLETGKPIKCKICDLQPCHKQRFFISSKLTQTWVMTLSISAFFSAVHFLSDISFWRWAVTHRKTRQWCFCCLLWLPTNIPACPQHLQQVLQQCST